MKSNRIVIGATLIVVWCAAGAVSAADVAKERYVPLYACDHEQLSPSWTDRIGPDFNYARCAATLSEARERWLRYLKQYDTPDGFEDGFHFNHVAAAHRELARVFYLLDDREAGDRHLRRAMKSLESAPLPNRSSLTTHHHTDILKTSP